MVWMRMVTFGILGSAMAPRCWLGCMKPTPVKRPLLAPAYMMEMKCPESPRLLALSPPDWDTVTRGHWPALLSCRSSMCPISGLSLEIRLAQTQTGKRPGSHWPCSQEKELLFFLLSDAQPFSSSSILGSAWLLTFPTLFLSTVSSVLCLGGAWHP